MTKTYYLTRERMEAKPEEAYWIVTLQDNGDEAWTYGPGAGKQQDESKAKVR